MRSRIVSLTVALALATPAVPSLAEAPAKKPLTLEKITATPPLVEKGPSTWAWRDATHATFVLFEGPGPNARQTLWQVDAVTGKKVKLLDPLPVPPAEAKPAPAPAAKEDKDAKPEKPEKKEEKQDKAIKDEKDVKKDEPKTEKKERTKSERLSFTDSVWSPSGTALLLSTDDDLFLYDTVKKSTRRLTNDEDEEEYPVFSPNGAYVAYVKKNDLFVVEVATGTETRLSTTGTREVLNGKLDWVYEEELANRKSGRAFEWSPDSKNIVYLRLDDTKVPLYPIVDYIPTNGKLIPQRYPKAGDVNPRASAHIVDLLGKETNGFANYGDEYIGPEFSWTADSKFACAVTIHRSQTELSYSLVPRDENDMKIAKILMLDADDAWLNSIEPPRFLKDGSGYVLLSEYTGFLHLYRFGMDGKKKNDVTKGEWMIDGAYDVDEKNGWAYFTATEKDPRERHIYRVKLDGSELKRLSTTDGHHELKLSPTGAYYIDTYSDIATPPKAALFKSDGTRVATVFEPRSELGEYAVGTTEMGSFKSEDGTLFYTKLVKPADFDPAKKYPVVVYVYGGPHRQVVQNGWGHTSLFDLYLASQGYLVWSIDNRGSWGRGHKFESPILKKMGETELKDQLLGLAELKKKPFVDGSRVGIWGWSYGGYLTLYAATHAGDQFKCAVAGAPVVDWKYYDSIYTERYMKMPKENAAGYEAASPLAAAKSLGTKLLLLHGTSDDNVHMQNTMAFIDELVKAKKDFDFVPLPRQKHGPRDPAARLYANKRIAEFFAKNL